MSDLPSVEIGTFGAQVGAVEFSLSFNFSAATSKSVPDVAIGVDVDELGVEVVALELCISVASPNNQ